MIKQIFKTSLIVTVISLVITLVMLPFGVRSMVDTVNQWAEYASYEVEYQEPAGSVTQVNVKFTGLEWQSCGIPVHFQTSRHAPVDPAQYLQNAAELPF